MALRSRAFAALAGGALVVSGCNSGGDDSASLRFDKAELVFAGIQGLPLPSQKLVLTASGGGSYYPGVRSSPPGLLGVTWAITGDRTAEVTVRPASAVTPATMPTGIQSGTVTFLACADEACNSIAASTSARVVVDVLAIDRTPLTFRAYENLSDTARQIAITPGDPGATLVLSVTAAAPAGKPWLSVGRNGDDRLAVSASAAGLTAARYDGAVQVTRPGLQGSIAIPVTFVVDPATIAPAPTTVTVTAGTAPSALAGDLTLGFQDGIAPAWMASKDRDWLVLGTTTGTGAASLPWAIDQAKLDARPNWTSDTATVTFHAPGLADVTSTVTLEKRLPELTTITSPLPAGRAATVRAIGRGLGQLTSAADVTLSGAAAVTGTVVSDREVLLDIPALAAGTHTVSIPNALGIASRGALLEVLQPNTLSAASVAHAGENRNVVLDVRRGALYAVAASGGTLVRYRLVDGAWTVDDLAVTNLVDLALAPDGGTLYATTGSLSNTFANLPLLEIDPVSLTVKASHTPSTAIGCIATWLSSSHPQFTSDGRLWLPQSGWSDLAYFDTAARTFGMYDNGGAAGTLSFYGPLFAASGDGSHLLVAASNEIVPDTIAPAWMMWSYSPEAQLFTRPPLAPSFSGGQLSTDGSRILMGSLYDTETWALLGKLPALGAGSASAGAALSPDGTRVYRLLLSTANVVTAAEVFDAAARVTGTTDLVKLGEIAITEVAASCASNAGSSCSYRPRLLVSPLGDTLFLVGNQRLVVVPIPENLSGAVTP